MRDEINLYLNHIKTICPEITEKELDEFSNGLYITKLEKNEYYIKTGDIQKQGGFLISGLIRAYHIDSSGNQKNIYFIPENEYSFHYASFMDNKPCPITFQCLEPTIIVNFPVHQLHKAYSQIPIFERYGRLIVEEKLKIQQQRLEGFLYQNAEQRYIAFTNNYPQLFNRISISQLCSYLGVERQTLTRIRKKLYQLR